TPIFITSDHVLMAGQLERFFYPANLVGGLIIGLFFVSLYLRVQKFRLKLIILFLVLVLMAQGLASQSLWLIFGYPPRTENGDAKLFAQINSLEGRAYSWVKENTLINDYFLIIKKDYTECGESSAPNCIFILNTGRIAPTYDPQVSGNLTRELPSLPEAGLFSEIRGSCSPALVKKLNYSYLYVDEKWPAGMEEKCREGNTLELKFESSAGDKFVRIYKIVKDN
ncbi:MAG: hypothetical protein HYZ69_03980, partial [Candidatus Colwellbacteria bacterium]|nr:hypothetical protein [Candidatus Colwellbacteria bacterium]